MKNIIATLLIALAISVSAQERTSALKDLSNVDPATGRTALDVYSKAESDALTPSIDNSAINAAIAEDPEATKAALGAEFPLYGTDYGIVSGNSADAVAEANAAAIATAFAASATTKKPLILTGVIYVKGEVKLSGNDGTIIGHGAQIIQKDVNHHILTLDTVNPPNHIRITGLKLTGQGSATHAKAGIYARNESLTYFVSEVVIRDCWIEEIRTGISACQIARFMTENVTIAYVRVGMDWQAMQTAICIFTRIVQGDGNASSACFKLDGGNFSTRILGHEFGGTGFARFADVSNGAQLYAEDCNLEVFTSSQMINVTGGGRITLRRCRIASTHTASQAVISAEVTNTGLSGLPIIEWKENQYVSSGRRVEIWGSTTVRSPVVYGDQIPVTFAATQGGTATQTVWSMPSSVIGLDGNIPSAADIGAGGMFMLSPSTATNSYSSDVGATNPVIRYFDNRRGTTRIGSMSNDMLCQVWAANTTLLESSTTTDVRTVTTSETDLISATIPSRYSASFGDSNKIECFGTTAANANDKTFKVYLAGTNIIDFGAIAANDETWKLDVTLQRGFGGTGRQKVVAVLTGGTAIGTRVRNSQTTPTDTSSMIFKVTGTGTSTGDITMLGGKAWWLRAPTVLGN